MTPAELKRTLFQHVDSNPYYFTDGQGKVDIFKNDLVAKKYIGLRAISEGIIRKSQSGRELEWVKDGTKILRAPIGVDIIDQFAEYLARRRLPRNQRNRETILITTQSLTASQNTWGCFFVFIFFVYLHN